jgi:hypothetical protein
MSSGPIVAEKRGKQTDMDRPVRSFWLKLVCEEHLIILKKIGFEDVDWIHVTEDCFQWLALLDTMMYIYIS